MNTPVSHPEEKGRRPVSSPPPTGSPDRATIGRSITILGEVNGDEDLLIQGRVEGSVDLKEQSVTVGPEGRVKANISGRVVVVEGEVEGDLIADEQVILRGTARVKGDITAARVVLEDGANFRGLVDMGEQPKADKGSGDRSGSLGEKATESSKPGMPAANKPSTELGKAPGGSEKEPPGTVAETAP